MSSQRGERQLRIHSRLDEEQTSLDGLHAGETRSEESEGSGMNAASAFDPIRDAAAALGVTVRRKPNLADVLLVPCPRCGKSADLSRQDGGGWVYWCDCDSRWVQTSPEDLKRGWERQGLARSVTGPAEEEDSAPPRYARSDAGNAELLAALFGDKVRYVHRGSGWCLWNGKRWSDDAKRCAEQLALLVARHRLELAAYVAHDGTRADEAKWALRSENVAKRRDMLAAAATLRQLAVLPGEFDKHPWTLNCDNGLLDLRTGELRPHESGAMCAKLAPVAYDPEAKAPRWERFLQEVFAGDAELAEFVQRAVGYSLTGDTSEECLFLLHGNGANGKSTLLAVLQELLDDYACQADFATFTADRERQALRNDLARLHGARLVVASETSEGIRVSEAVVKSLTGRDRITARFLYKEHFEFQPVAKYWLAVNHRPRVRDTSEAFWRRIRLVPFEVSFRGREDKRLRDTLRGELPGVLAWAVRGCLEWQQRGDLDPPGRVLAATDSYRQEEDVLAQFIADCCLVGDGLHVPAGQLYKPNADWCESGGEDPLSQT